MIRNFFRCLIFLFLASSCNPSSSEKNDFFSLRVLSIDGQRIGLSEIKKTKAAAFFFLSPDCPLSQKYSLTIKDMFSEYSKANVAVYLVFPGTLYSAEEIKTFLTEYDLPFISIADSDKKLTANLQATVTPEVFLMDSERNILYKGAIDNWFEAVGRQRQVITEHFLADALQSFLSGNSIKVSETKAVGCIIE